MTFSLLTLSGTGFLEPFPHLASVGDRNALEAMAGEDSVRALHATAIPRDRHAGGQRQDHLWWVEPAIVLDGVLLGLLVLPVRPVLAAAHLAIELLERLQDGAPSQI